MKRLWIPLLGLTLLLSACAPHFDQKTQLKEASTTVRTEVAAEREAIATISEQIGAFPAAFTQAYADDPDADFQTTGTVSKLIATREAAYERLEKSQSKLEAATNQLTKFKNQPAADLPKPQLRQLLTTLRLAKLDHKTFDAYYHELTNAEAEFFDLIAADSSDKEGIQTALAQLNQYQSSLGQQTDIMEANLESVTTDAAAFKKALAQMQ